MSSQKKVIQFIKDNYDGDMDRALSVLQRHIPSTKKKGRPLKDHSIEHRIYSTIYLLSMVRYKHRENDWPIRYTKPTSHKAIIDKIKPLCREIKSFLDGRYYIPNDDYNKWRKRRNLKTIPKKTRETIDIAKTMKKGFQLATQVTIPPRFRIDPTLEGDNVNTIMPDGFLEHFYYASEYLEENVNSEDIGKMISKMFNLPEENSKDIYLAYLFPKLPEGY